MDLLEVHRRGQLTFKRYRAVDESVFGDARQEHVRDADIAVVFYAGHGMEMNGVNYLIPVDATIARDVDVEDEAIPLDRVIRTIEPARRLQLVILDACRDNPFLRSMRRTVISRSMRSSERSRRSWSRFAPPPTASK